MIILHSLVCVSLFSPPINVPVIGIGPILISYDLTLTTIHVKDSISK